MTGSAGRMRKRTARKSCNAPCPYPIGGGVLAALVALGRTVVTILHANQYQGLASFTEVGDFVPLCRDRAGAVTREVASARFALRLPDHPGQTLPLAVALIRDWRTPVPPVPAPAESPALERWDADLGGALAVVEAGLGRHP